MTPRLLAVAAKVDSGAFLADIGTDHAYIPIYLMKKGIIAHGVAADVNTGPLERARENILKNGLEEKIEVRLSNGFESISPVEYDTAVIAGMGGLLIWDIIKNAPRGKKLVLQPMTAAPELKRLLFDNGYKIEKETLAKDNNKIYDVFSVCDGREEYDFFDLYAGRLLFENDDPLLPEYLERLKKKCLRIIEGMEKADKPDMAELDRYKKLLERIAL